MMTNIEYKSFFYTYSVFINIALRIAIEIANEKRRRRLRQLQSRNGYLNYKKDIMNRIFYAKHLTNIGESCEKKFSFCRRKKYNIFKYYCILLACILISRKFLLVETLIYFRQIRSKEIVVKV